MKKKIDVFVSFSLLMIVLFHMIAFSAATEGPYSGGKGTAENPYIISSAEDFLKIPDGSESEYILVSDITLPSTYIPKTFGGKLKGRASVKEVGKITLSISGNSDNTYSSGYGTGLFSSLYGNAHISDIEINGNIQGTNLVGAIAGITLDNAKIEGCINNATVIGNGFNVGGICGAVRNNVNGTAISSCHNKGTVENENSEGSWTGGITGHNLQALSGCSNTGSITGNTSVGGIAGAQYLQSATAVLKCYNSGRVAGKNYIGGIAGCSRYVSGGIASSYNSGRIIATGLRSDGTFVEVSEIYAGGITSGGMPGVKNSGVTISNCYNSGEVLGGRDVNNIYSYGGCGSTAGVEAASNAVITNCYTLNHSKSIYPSYKKPDAYIKIKTPYQLGKADMVGEAGLPAEDFVFDSSAGYPYPQISGNLHDSLYTEPQLTEPLINVSAKGLNKSVLLKWNNAENFNHDTVEIHQNDKIIDRISLDETEYLVNNLNENTEYNFSVFPLNDYKKSTEQQMLSVVTNVAGVSEHTEVSLPVTNHSFDNGMDGFKIINGNHVNVSFPDNSLSINDGDNRAYEIESDWQLVSPGVSYKLQVDSIQQRTNGYPYVYINYYDANKNKLAFRPSVRITDNSNRYSEHVIDYNAAPENACYISISLTTTSSYTGNVSFDNIRLTASYSDYSDRYDDEAAVENVCNQLQISFNGNDSYSAVSNNLNLLTMTSNGVFIYWLSDNADVIDNCGIISDSAIEGNQVTLTAVIVRGKATKTKEFVLQIGTKISKIELYNQGFELGTDGYIVESTGTPDVLTSNFSFSEDKSLNIITKAEENVVISGHKTKILPLESYSAYIMVYKNKGNLSLSIEFSDADDNIIKSETRAYNGELSMWNTLGVIAKAPSDAVYANVKVIFSAKTECYVDDFNISKTFTDLGMPIQIDYIQSAAMGKNEKGKDVIYTVITNETADGASKFVIVDIATKSVVKTIEIEGVAGAGAIVVDNENNVYIGTYEGGKLFKYIPGQDFLIDLGTPIAGQTHIVSLAVDSKGTVYGGTYPGCYVFSLRKNSTDYEIISPNGNNQPFVIGEQYAKSIAVDENNNILYVGTATHAKLYRYDMNTRVASEILPDVYESNTHIYNLKYENGKLFAYVYPEGKLLVMSFNANGESVTEKILSGSGTVSRAVNNISYFINSDRKISGYNYITGEVFALNNQKVYTTACLMDVVDMNDDKYPGLTFVAFANGIQRENRLVTYNISNNSIEIAKVELPTVDYSARSVMTGPEGSIYTSNHLGGGVGVYNPVNDTKNMFVGLPQAESGIALNGKMYFGTYTMGKIYEYNPEEPWQFESNGEINPRRIDTLGNTYEQDRPFASAAGDGLVFFGTAPQYGKLGGAIAIYNPNNLSEKYVVRNIVKDQSVTALAYKDGYLYGGTSVWGGIGATPTQKESKFFIFDVKNKVKVREFVIAEGSQLISSLIVGTDGNIWGLCDGYLFMYNTDTDVIEYNMLKFPEMNSGGSVTAPKLYGANLVCGKDGYIYGVTGSKLFKLNPYSQELEILRTGKFISATMDFLGNIYYSDYSSIWKYSYFDSKDVLTVKTAPDIATYPSYYDDGNIAVFFSEYLNDNNFNIKEYGVIFSRRDNPELEFSDSIKLKSNTVLNSKGQFGIALKNSKQLRENEYYIRTYVIYENNGNIYNAYGNTIRVTAAKINL